MRLLTLTLFLALRPSVSTLTAAEKLEAIEFRKKNALTCGQGLTDCKIKHEGTSVDRDDTVYVSGLAANALLCHSHKGWRPCLRINLNITTEGFYEDSGVSGETNHEDEVDERKEEEHGSSLANISGAFIQVCYSTPGFFDTRKLFFKPTKSSDSAAQMWMSLIVELQEAHYGSTFTIFSSATLEYNFSKHVTLPSVDKVCNQDLDIPLCNVPVLYHKINHTTGMIDLHVNTTGRGHISKLQACQMMENEGECLKLEWKDNPLTIPLSSAAPCLCFQVWWSEGESRRKICPFLNATALSGSNISVSVEEKNEIPTGHRNSTALVWNITAPCRLEAEFQLCKKTWGHNAGCHVIQGSRKTRLHIHKHHPKWKNLNRRWEFHGEFAEVEPHPSLCVQVKVKGMEGYFEPVCPFEGPRAHWSFVVLVCVVLMCLTVLGAYAVQGTLKGWVFRWLKVDIRGTVGASQIVLLYPPDADSSLAELVCRLGSGLSSLGFSVSLDLWSRSELNALGPVPWLHSRLDRVQRHGGKVVLVLTQDAWVRAEEWSRGARARDGEEQKDGNEEEDSSHCVSASPHSDVFSASLSCILADYLQGRAGERFVLAQFEAQPAVLPGTGGPLPELFRGLPLFSLPSQSLAFLTEITNGTQKRHAGRASNRRMRAGVLRAGSKALAEALRELRGETGYRLAGFRSDDPWESIPLQQGLSSPTASPELHSRSGTVNWV